MSKFDQSKKTKDDYTKKNIELIHFLNVQRTKDEIQKHFAVSERDARRLISELSLYYPVIAYSSGKGYRIAKPLESLSTDEIKLEHEEANHTLNELKSRERYLKRKMKSLIAYMKVAEKMGAGYGQ